MSRRNLSNKLVWIGAATIVAAAMLVPAALADKPASKSKPIAAEKTWVKVGGGKGYGTYLKLGLSLKEGDVTVRVRNLVIVANVATVAAVSTDTSKLTAQVNGKRIDFATLKFGAFPVIAGKTVTASVAEVRLTAAAASALNGAFGGSAILENTLVGSAMMKARLIGKGKA